MLPGAHITMQSQADDLTQIYIFLSLKWKFEKINVIVLTWQIQKYVRH